MALWFVFIFWEGVPSLLGYRTHSLLTGSLGQDPSKVDYMIKCDAAPAKPFDCSDHYCLFNVTADPCEHHDLSATVGWRCIALDHHDLAVVEEYVEMLKFVSATDNALCTLRAP